MSISKSFRAFHPAAAITLIAALSFPCATQAINIGAVSGNSSGKLNANREGEPSGGKTEGGLELSLSARPLDEARIGEISQEERDLWRLKQKLFYVDDQMNNLLIMQHQLKQMRAELGSLAPRVAGLGSGVHVATGGAGQQAGLPVNPAATVIHAAGTVDTESSAMMLTRMGVSVALAFLVALALFFGLRRYRMARLQHGNQVLSTPDLPANPQVAPAVPVIRQAQSFVQPGKVKVDRVSPLSVACASDTDKLAEVDSMIEEAELYAIHGHPNKAIEILNDIILEYPDKDEVWLLLLSLFGNKKNVQQFESMARKFLSNKGMNNAWKGICKTGRRIDPDNPLYFDAESAYATNAETDIKPGRRRLLGDILVDMNAISMSDLENRIAHFDYLRDGRFGNYLVACGLIEQKQLDEALQQQSKEAVSKLAEPQINSDTRAASVQDEIPHTIGDVLVQMGVVGRQELEHALVDFSPKLHGHCGTYLVTCGLITKRQLYDALLNQIGGAMTVELSAPVKDMPAGDSDEVPWDLPDRWIR